MDREKVSSAVTPDLVARLVHPVLVVELGREPRRLLMMLSLLAWG